MKASKYKKFTCLELTFEEYSALYSTTKINIDSIYSITQTPNYKIKTNNIIYIGIYLKSELVALTIVQRHGYLFGLFNIARLNRGPHFVQDINISQYKFLFKSLYKFLKSKSISMLFISPNINNTHKNNHLPFLSFKLPIEPSASTTIKLSNNIESVLKSFKSKWRNTLRKGLKIVSVEEIGNVSDLDGVLDDYVKYANHQSFKPLSTIQLRNWWITNKKYSDYFPELRVYRAFLSEDPQVTIASIGIARFLKTSIYLFGFSSTQGKRDHANSVLLWHAIKEAIMMNSTSFDLGGLSPSTPNGIRRFKQGLNGKPYQMIGEYLSVI